MRTVRHDTALSITAIWFILVSFACSTTPIATATDTPRPTDTPAPTSTATSTLTATSQPTDIPTATMTPIPLLTSQTGRVVRSESFDNPSTLSFGMYGSGKYDIAHGHIILTDQIATNGNPWADGESAGRSTFSPQVGNISVFSFMVGEKAYFGYHYELYEDTKDGVLYRGVNLDGSNGSVSLYIDKGYGNNHATQTSMPVSKFKPNTWYFYALQAQPNGLFTAQIWEQGHADTPIFNRNFQLDEGWTQPGFTFVITSYQGTFEIDEYQEIQ